MKFEGIISSIKARGPMGSPRDDDIERAVLAIYNCEGTVGKMYTFMRSQTADVGPKFVFRSSLSFFQTTYTWDYVLQFRNGRCASQSAPNMHATSTDTMQPDNDSGDLEKNAVTTENIRVRV